MKSGGVDGPGLSFSIVIPTYKRPQYLAACLESVAALDYPAALVDVVVVDDGGDVPLEGVVAPYRGRLSVTLVRQGHGGPGAARNTGAAQGRGAFLAFVDDDCRPAPDWLRVLAQHLDAAPSTVVGGLMANALPGNIYSAAGQALIEAVNAYFNADPACANNLITGNLALSRADFWRAGGFDATLLTSEDRDFCDRCQEAGYRLVYAQDVVVAHTRPLTFGTFWRQHFTYGQGTFDFHRRRAHRGSAPVKFDGRFYLHMLRYPFSGPTRARALMVCGLLIIAQAAKTVGLLWRWIRLAAARRSVFSVEDPQAIDQIAPR